MNLLGHLSQKDQKKHTPLFLWPLFSGYNNLTLLGQLGQNLTWLDLHLLGLTLSLEKTRSLFPFNLTRSLWRKGQNFELDKKEIRFNGVKQNIGFNNLCFVDLRLEADISKGTIVLAPDLTFGKGHLVSNPNIKK